MAIVGLYCFMESFGSESLDGRCRLFAVVVQRERKRKENEIRKQGREEKKSKEILEAKQTLFIHLFLCILGS
jgi:hypothetical protein